MDTEREFDIAKLEIEEENEELEEMWRKHRAGNRYPKEDVPEEAVEDGKNYRSRA